MITEIFTRPKYDFTHLGWLDGWLGRTLIQTSLVVVLEKIKGPAHMVEGDHLLKKRTQPPLTKLVVSQHISLMMFLKAKPADL